MNERVNGRRGGGAVPTGSICEVGACCTGDVTRSPGGVDDELGDGLVVSVEGPDADGLGVVSGVAWADGLDSTPDRASCPSR